MPASQPKSDGLYHQVRQDILALQLGPGAGLRLPILSERYGIGLTPLRECLNRLAAENLVIPEHNKGFRVAPLSHDDLLDLEQSRSAVEGALFVQSVQQGGDAWEGAVVAAFHHLSKTPTPSALQSADDLAQWTNRHAAFHAALISGVQSVWMHRFCDQLGDQLGRYHLFIQNGLRALAVTHPDLAPEAAAAFGGAMELGPHQALYDLALARDVAGAKGASDAHSNLSIQAFKDLMRLIPTETDVASTLQPHKSEARP